MKNLIIIISLFLFSCKGSPTEIVKLSEKEISNTECEIPSSVLKFLEQNKNKFKLIEPDKELKLIDDFVNKNICPTVVYGDFNDNEKPDLAIILRYSEYKVSEFGNYNFPFLVFFNDYEEKIKPIIVYKTGDYKNEDIKTVIYDQFDDGISSFIKKGNLCNQEVIEIVIPEKSSFYIKWNEAKQEYEYFNVLDEIDCEEKEITSKKNDLYKVINGTFVKDLCTPTNEIGTAICEEYILTISKDSIQLKILGHMTDKEEIFFVSEMIDNSFKVYNMNNDLVGKITISSDSLYFNYSNFLEGSDEKIGENGFLFKREL